MEPIRRLVEHYPLIRLSNIPLQEGDMIFHFFGQKTEYGIVSVTQTLIYGNNRAEILGQDLGTGRTETFRYNNLEKLKNDLREILAIEEEKIGENIHVKAIVYRKNDGKLMRVVL